MAEVGEPILSASFKVLFDKLDNPIIKDSSPDCGIDADLEKLEETLLMIETVHTDADVDVERPQNNKKTPEKIKKEVNKWLNQLIDLAYDAEDAIEEYGIYVEKYQVRCSIPHEIKNDIKSEIKKMNERLEKLKNRMTVLGLKSIYGEGRMSNEIINRSSTSSILLDESYFYGRETDKINLISKLLIWDGPSDQKIYGVIPIVGMGGLGKTTLAQSVYNYEKLVNRYFDLKAWVRLSEEVDSAKITRDIIESATMEPCFLRKLETLQMKLKEIVW
uniref:Disease resistance RPP13-like protein 1 n=1 Tax=Nelumbo nucifera TaxID=4432 RepID=A0A822ZPD1_NELNU|nr:TPA_asm: hypothetical protein HUJ06_003585 [Nelumbo nucifera]